MVIYGTKIWTTNKTFKLATKPSFPSLSLSLSLSSLSLCFSFLPFLSLIALYTLFLLPFQLSLCRRPQIYIFPLSHTWILILCLHFPECIRLNLFQTEDTGSSSVPPTLSQVKVHPSDFPLPGKWKRHYSSYPYSKHQHHSLFFYFLKAKLIVY